MDKKQDVVFHALSSFIAIVLAGLYVALRYPFEIEYIVVLKLLLTSLAVINIPYFIYIFLINKGGGNIYITNLLCVILILFFLVIAAICNFNKIIYLLLFFGLVSFLITVYDYFRFFTVIRLLHLFIVLVFCFWISYTVWACGYLTPLLLEKIIAGFYKFNNTTYGLDSLYHMAITQVIKTYNTVSTGLDEVPYIPYHFGSHYLFAQISKALDIPVPLMYNVGYPVIFITLFFHFVFLVFHQLRDLQNYCPRFDFVFWLLFTLVFIGFFPIHNEGIASRSYLVSTSILSSESYLVSWILSLMLFLILHKLAEIDGSNKQYFYFALLAFTLILVGITKISTLFLWDCILTYLFIWYGYHKKFIANIFMLFLVFISIVLFYITFDPKGPGGGIEYLHFFHKYIRTNFAVFVVLHLFWTFVLIAIWLYLYIHKIKVSTIFIELQVLVAVVGLGPGFFLKIAGGSAFFFSDIQHWTALFAMAYYIGFFVQQVKKSKYRYIFKAGSLLLIPCFLNCLWCLENLLKDNYNVKNNIMGATAFYPSDISMDTLIVKRKILYNQQVAYKLYSNPDYLRLKYLISLDSLQHKSGRILYLKDKDFLLKYFTCIKVPFFVVGATGISLLNGYWTGSCFWSDYGAEHYTEYRKPPENEDFCTMLRNPSFSQVVQLNIEDRSYSIMECKK